MSNMSVSEVRGRFAEAIERAHGEPVTVSRRGRRQVVLVDPEHFDRLTEAAEELADITAFDEAMAEAGENIPWAQVKADLGWA
jgi:prevent-host-death family protein